MIFRYLAAGAALGVLVSAIAMPVRAQEPAKGTETSSAAEAKPPLIPVATFAAQDLFGDARLSPDGKHIALRVAKDGRTVLNVLAVGEKRSVASAMLGTEVEYNWHRWAGPDVVLISVSQLLPVHSEEVRVSRLMALRISTGQRWFVGPKAMGIEGDDLLHVAEDGSSVLLSFQKSIFDWPGVTRISLLDQADKGVLVQKPIENVWEWYSDDKGVVRMGMGWVGRKVRITYRGSGEDKFREIARIGEDDKDKFYDVRRIVGGSDEGYVLEEDKDGRTVLAKVNLSTRTRIETVYRNADWDVTDAWLDDTGKPYAVAFTDDRDRMVWLQPEMAKLQGQLDKALQEDEVWVGSRATDGSRMLVFAGGEADPGALYLYDSKKRALDVFANFRPDLDIGLLARPKPIAYTARDGTAIKGYLTLPRGRAPKGLPLVILPHGGPYGVRDKLSYDDEVQFLANRGYAVLQPNFRGSGGYGSAHEEKGDGQIGRAMQDDIDDAMDWAVAQGFADKGRVCVVGSSYGGYAAMWSVLRNPERYRCAASFAGVTDWKKLLKYDAKFFSRKGAKKWNTRITGEGAFDLDTVAPAHTIARLKRPLLVAHGKRDTNVPYSQFKLLAAQAGRSGVTFEQMVFDETGHGFDKPEDEARWLSGLEDFLRKHNPPD